MAATTTRALLCCSCHWSQLTCNCRCGCCYCHLRMLHMLNRSEGGQEVSVTVAVLVPSSPCLMALVTACTTSVNIYIPTSESVIMALAQGPTLMDSIGASLMLASVSIATRGAFTGHRGASYTPMTIHAYLPQNEGKRQREAHGQSKVSRRG